MAEPQLTATELPVRALSVVSRRPAARGKFLWAGDEKFLIRGVTYGTFAPNRDGDVYPERAAVARDFAAMAANSINTVRTYTAPPPWLFDTAQRFGLKVMVGLPWEEHVTFLDSRSHARKIERRMQRDIELCAEHPAVLAYVIGNEIPSSIVRWHGPSKIAAFISRLCRAAKEVDPDGLVTYANYPSTEYLDPRLQDFVSFNVFLESQDRLRSYLRRLQNIAGDRPLVVSELGLDSRRHGDLVQAASIEAQVGCAFEAGCAGACVFSWTDEWSRNGEAVEDWDFGLVTRDRREKPALAAVKTAFDKGPFGSLTEWPSMSVVVCTHNGATTISDSLDGLAKIDYPNFEVIVVDDGSTDGSAAIAARKGVKVVSTPPLGLSNARNVGLQAASGEIIAYLDDDAWPDPDWLSYLALSFKHTSHVGVGGPNVPPSGNHLIADAVARAPGGPIHVMLGDDQAEHIPGCNMAFRRSALEAVGGFDPQFWVAGDDVDICWRLQAMGWTLGFSPAAMVWHRRRSSVRGYLRQQAGYGKAEALLERKWPEHYNGGGHVKWAGRVYADNSAPRSGKRWRIYYGVWGAGMFQSVYARPLGLLSSLPLMPQSYLLMATMALLMVGGLLWPPLLIRLPGVGAPLPLALLTASVALLVGQAMVSGWYAFPRGTLVRGQYLRYRLLTAFLYLAQPIARVWGRMRHGLTPWRRRGRPALGAPWPHRATLWSERWQPIGAWARILERQIHNRALNTRRGSAFDRWDLEAGSGLLVAVRLRLALEEHGGGRQLVRMRVWPRFSGLAFGLLIASAALLGLAFLGRANTATVVALGAVLGIVVAQLVAGAASVAAVCDGAFSAMAAAEVSPRAGEEVAPRLAVLEVADQ